MKEHFDKIIIGAGLYGLYAAHYCGSHGQKVLVLECEQEPFQRATYINQARVHQGYHYPRSLSTALKSAGYFERFVKDFSFCINREFEQIYATSSRFSWSDGNQFREFCRAAGIPCEELHPENYFKEGMCDGAYRTREFAYDAKILCGYFVNEIHNLGNGVTIRFGLKIAQIKKNGQVYNISTADGLEYETAFVLNATYAGINQVLTMAGFETFPIKYELCEIILCEVNEKLKNIGITVMDGPFFSIMPFGLTEQHSLTAVTFTPHDTSYASLPEFSCQAGSEGTCSPEHLGNCNSCPSRPQTAYPYMSNLAKKYLREDYGFSYSRSLYSMKPILQCSEIDDSRPTVIRTYSENPTFATVLSGKINTVYDLDDILCS